MVKYNEEKKQQKLNKGHEEGRYWPWTPVIKEAFRKLIVFLVLILSQYFQCWSFIMHKINSTQNYKG